MEQAVGEAMSNDPLDNEVSVSVELTAQTGLPAEIKGKAKSRAISAFDRLLGNLVDFSNAWLEAAPAKKTGGNKCRSAGNS